MASKAGVLNRALHHIKLPESNIVLTDTNEWVVRARNRYPESVKAVLECHPWNFASSVRELTSTEPTPAGWAYGFSKPSTCMRIIKVTSAEYMMNPDYDGIVYEDRGGRILSNAASTFLKFVDAYFMPRTGDWPQVFADAVSATIAESVGPVTESSEVTRDMLAKIKKRAISEAKTYDAQQNPHWRPPASKWQRARFSGRGGAGGGYGN